MAKKKDEKKKGTDKPKKKVQKETAITVTLANDKALGDIFVKSKFFEDAKDQSQAIVKILAGREVGLQPIESMTGIHIIKGKISFGANMMAAAVKKHPKYDYKVTEHTQDKCVIDFIEGGNKTGTSSFSIADAKRAGLNITTGSWYKYPKAMLFARAMSAGVRYYCPDVFGYAPVYVPEEMGAVVGEDGEPTDVTPRQAPAPFPEGQPMQDAEHRDIDVEYTDTEAGADIGEEEPEDDGDDEVREIPDDLVDDDMTPRDALKAIMGYATDNDLGATVRPVIIEHYPEYSDGSRYPYHIPEAKVIKIVEELTGTKLKKAEKVKKCSRKDCGAKITEPEAEEQQDEDEKPLCLKCWLKENE